MTEETPKDRKNRLARERRAAKKAQAETVVDAPKAKKEPTRYRGADYPNNPHQKLVSKRGVVCKLVQRKKPVRRGGASSRRRVSRFEWVPR
jgi:hypothetical protein